MRPRGLEVAGFTAFRDRTVVDFTDAEIFAFTGPTGSGKSSLIDAIVFSLYGSVPRYADKRAVAPLISLGKLEARVRFDFTIEDEDWTVVRVVRRKPGGGASTEEARLEHRDEVVAGTADEVTKAVEDLLGLEFDHFTKSVVLPQGDFARFLHDRPSKRQSLLRSLLDLEVFADIRELASQEGATLIERLRALEARRADLGFATTAGKAEAEGRVAALEELHDRLAEAEPELEKSIAKKEAAEKLAEVTAENAHSLSELRVPEIAPSLAEDLVAIDTRLAAAESTAGETAERVSSIERRRNELGDQSELIQQESAAEELDRLGSKQADVAAALGDLQDQLVRASEEASAAGREVDRARRHLEAARSAHAAHALAADLHAGEPCPVCLRIVEEMPEPTPAPGLTGAEDSLRLATEASDRLQSERATVDATKSRLEGRSQDLSERAEELKRRLPERLTRDEIAARLEAIHQAEAELNVARQTAAESQEVLVGERAKRDQLQADVDRLRKAFDLARDRIAKLEPPQPDRDDVYHDWKQLAAWAETRREELEMEAAHAKEKAAKHRTDSSELARRLDEMLVSHGLDPDEGTSREKTSFQALTGARHELDAISEAVDELKKTEGKIEEASQQRAVAELLALHLRADRFEAWLLDEALRALVGGANELLGDLSQGAYSLRLAGRNFEVVDHSNADETRSVRTLSGGETFLVSLSLALSLAEQLSRMSSRGGAPIETIFLDEGFGTLDRETLETVGGVIHELGARGRTVGLVTHVAELAEQVPVRFEVAKGVRSATVTRADA